MLNITLFAQKNGFQIDDEVYFGGDLLDVVTDMTPTDDGGFLCIGYTESYGTGFYGHSDLWLVKIDSVGNKLWDKTYGQADSLDRAYSIKPTDDNNFIIVGERLEDIIYRNGWEAIIMKIDPEGNEIWEKKYGGGTDEADMFRHIETTNDGGFIMCGASRSYGAQFIDAWMFKIDENGNEEWNKIFGEEGYEVFKQVYQTSDGGFIAAGFTNSDFGAGDYDYYVVKTDAEGNEEWTKTYGNEFSNRAYYLMPTENGNYLLTGSYRTGNSNNDVYDMHNIEFTEEDGTIIWEQTYPDTTNMEPYYAIKSTDGGYIFACGSGFAKKNKVYQTDLSFIKIDQNHNIVAKITTGGGASETPNTVYSFGNNKYIVGGYTMSYGAGSGDAWFVTLTDLTAPSIVNEIKNCNIKIYPNPSNGIFTINMKTFEKQYKMSITDITGRIIYSSLFKTEKILKKQIDLSNQKKGLYFLKINTENQTFTEKIIVR